MARGRPDRTRPAVPAGTARAAALRLLGRRDYTVAELRAKLLDRGFPPDDTARALDALVADGLADDRRAALAHIRTGSRVKGRGRHRLRQEMERRGVGPDLAAELLAEHSDDDERAALDRLVARKRPPGRLSMADRRRLFQQLLRRGFAADLIARALNEPGTDF
jgi:regulatory protein